MKKVLTLLVAMTMVIGFAGMAAAQDMCMDCGDPGYINRGCDTPVQGGSVEKVFDYNDTYPDHSYCGAKGDVHRAMLDVCECDAEWVGYNWTQIEEAGLTVDISMEILVDGQSGNNGVYWAEDVGSVQMWTDACPDAAMCSQTYMWDATTDSAKEAYDGNFYDLRPLHQAASLAKLPPYTWSNASAVDFYNSPKAFNGPYVYTDIDGDVAAPSISTKTTIMKADTTVPIGTTGYALEEQDILQGKCVWGFDIPAMWVDDAVISGGEVVTVKVTLTATNSQGLCHKDDCECEINIGVLCCPEEAVAGMGKTLTFPYMPRLYGYYEAQGIALTNLDSEEGEATATLYESDGDVFVATLTVPANNSFNITTAVMETMELQAGSTGNGVLGTVSGGYYFVIETDFNASGLAYFANADNGESLGYLPVTK